MCFISSNNKRGAHVNQNKKPLKKTVSLHPGQEKDPLPKAETVSYVCMQRIKRLYVCWKQFEYVFMIFFRSKMALNQRKLRVRLVALASCVGECCLTYGIEYIHNNEQQ